MLFQLETISFGESHEEHPVNTPIKSQIGYKR